MKKVNILEQLKADVITLIYQENDKTKPKTVSAHIIHTDSKMVTVLEWNTSKFYNLLCSNIQKTTATQPNGYTPYPDLIPPIFRVQYTDKSGNVTIKTIMLLNWDYENLYVLVHNGKEEGYGKDYSNSFTEFRTLKREKTHILM